MSASALPRIGDLRPGPRDAISDVAGVTVGHRTLAEGPVQTGVTVIRPHAGDPFRDKVPAAAVVLNGFGKSIGLVQLEELGVLETPIALTNTFSVGTVAGAQIRDCIAHNPETGRSLPTVNPLVFECNDGFLNDIQRLAVGEADYQHALADAGADFAQGSVGAGRGMSSFQLKGGIGSASRLVPVGAAMHTVGTLVLANYGRQPELRLAGHAVGERLAALVAERAVAQEPEKGSIIVVVATDAPLDARQLRRLALRAGPGWRAPARSSAMAAATSCWPYRPPTPCPTAPNARCRPWRCCTRRSSTGCSRRRPMGPSRRSCMRCGGPSR